MRQVQCEGNYEKMVLRMHEWMEEEGYDAFAEVIEVSPKRYELRLLMDEKGTPHVPEVEAVVDFLIGMSTGDVEKGGSRKARAKDWYASSLHGKSQAEMCMPFEKKGKYGWGAHKDLPFRLGRIGQHLSALRCWLKGQLMKCDVQVANPLNDGWIDQAMEHLTREVSKGRVEANLPPRLTDSIFNEVMAQADLQDDEEVQTVGYLGQNGVHGARAHDQAWLDRRDAQKLPAATDDGQVPGFKLTPIGTKNNKKQAPRPKALACRSGCDGMVALTAGGKLDVGKLCAACVFEFSAKRVDAKVGADAETVKDLPYFVDAQGIGDAEPGCTVVRCDNETERVGSVPQFVLQVTHEEHEAGMTYNGTVPFIADGREVRPRVRGTWFEVPNTGCIIRAWAEASRVTQRRRSGSGSSYAKRIGAQGGR